MLFRSPTILDAWRGEKWREPDLCEDTELQQVDLRLFTIALMPEECTVFLTNLFGEKAYQKLTSEEQIILGTAYLEDSVSNQRLQQMLEMHPTDIGKVLSGLVEKGMLLSEWKGRWTTYTINAVYKKSAKQLELLDMDSPKIEFRNETDKIIYNYICANGLITTKEVIANTKIKTQQGASVALMRLISRDLIVKRGSGHNVYYTLKKSRRTKAPTTAHTTEEQL